MGCLISYPDEIRRKKKKNSDATAAAPRVYAQSYAGPAAGARPPAARFPQKRFPQKRAGAAHRAQGSRLRVCVPGEGVSVLRDDTVWPVNSSQTMACSLLMVGLC